MRRVLLLLTGAALLAAAAAAAAKPAPAAVRPRVIVVGWDGADWSLLDALLKDGRLPHLKSLLEKGAQARLETYRPRASPLLWTTMATG